MLLGVTRDITEQKKMREALQLRAELLGSASDAIFVRNLDGGIVYVNEAACGSLGYNREELMKMNVRELVTPEVAEFFEARIKEMMEKGKVMLESALKCKDGSMKGVLERKS